jgi:transcriptional regulator with XRE-family HTH domain
MGTSPKYRPGKYAIGPRVRAVRLSLDLSQRELALRVGCSCASISLIERGTHRPIRIVEIALALDVDPRWLALGIGKPPLLAKRELTRLMAISEFAGPVQIPTVAEEVKRIWAKTPAMPITRRGAARDWWREKLPKHSRSRYAA